LTPLFEYECPAPCGFALKEDEDEWSKQLIGLLLWDEDKDECPVCQEEQISGRENALFAGGGTPKKGNNEFEPLTATRAKSITQPLQQSSH